MAHLVETMAYNKAETPWHGLGNPVDGDVSVEEMEKQAGLDWRVGTSRVQFRYEQDGSRKQGSSAKHNVLFREDTGEALDVVGPRYTPFQNREILEFFREYVEAGEMKLETAGSLKGGQVIWALAKMDQAFTVLVPDDAVEGYVLLMNPHQYGKSALAKFTGVRVVCNNTLTAALRNGHSGSVNLHHTREFSGEVEDEAKRRLGIAREQLDAYKRDAELLAQLTLTDEQAIRVAAKVLGGDEKTPEYDEQPRRTQRVLDLYGGEGYGSQLESAKGTGWGLLNAVTQYLDHEYGRSQDNRLQYVWMGGGERVKKTALKELLSLTA